MSHLRLRPLSCCISAIRPRLYRETPSLQIRSIFNTLRTLAIPLPITGAGPPPKPPLSQLSDHRYRLNLKYDRPHDKNSTPRRFWKEVHVAEMPGGFEIRLDKRALKTPDKNLLLIPLRKPLLAHAIALEWTHLRSAKEIQNGHLIPLTQLAARVIDIAATEEKEKVEEEEEVEGKDAASRGSSAEREAIIQTLIRYLDTDTLLCWAPTPPAHTTEPGKKTLRQMQIEAYRPLSSWLTTRLWPGVDLRPDDGDHGIGGAGQPRATREMVMNWMRSLDLWRLVGLERTTLASKSLLVGARLVSEWDPVIGGKGAWGVREACEAASIEVRWQTRQWGEVEDTHDVEKEDLGRQVGASWLMIVDTV